MIFLLDTIAAIFLYLKTIGEKVLAKLAEIRCFYRNLVRTVFVSFACVLSAISFGYAGEKFKCPRIVLGVKVENQEQYGEIVDWGNFDDPTYVKSFSIPGTVSYEGMCSNTPGQPGDIGNPEQAGLPGGGGYCWCRVNEFTQDGEQPEHLTGYPWVFMFTTPCTQNDDCARFCGDLGFWEGNLSEEDKARVQQALYTMDDPKCVYKLSYDCNDSVGGGNNSDPDAQNVSFYQSFATYSSSECPDHHSSQVLVGWDWSPQQLDACSAVAAVDYATSTTYPYPHHEDSTLYAHWCEMGGLCLNGGMPEDIVNWNDYWGNSPSSTATMGHMCSEDQGPYSGYVGTPSSTQGEYCWCRANYDNGYSKWVYTNAYTDYSACSDSCLRYCKSWSDNSDNSQLLTEGCKYKVRYECRNGSSQSPSIPSSGSQYFFGQTVNLTGSVSGCSVNPNELFTGWECVGDSTSTNVNLQNPYSFTMPQENVTCTAKWEKPCGDGTLVTEILGKENADDDYVDWNWLDMGGITGEVYGGNGSYLGVVVYDGMCSNTPGTLGMSGNPQPSAPGYCWCRVSGFTPAGGSGIQSLTGYPWVYFGNNNTCTLDEDCTGLCYNHKTWSYLKEMGLLSTFNHNLYTTYICKYNLTYKCNNDISNQTNMSGGTWEGGVNVPLWNQNNNHVGFCNIPNNSDFNGWDCDNNIGTVSGGGTFTMPAANVTCTAQWIPRKYNVTFAPGDSNNNGTGTSATGSTNPITDQYASSTITLPVNGFTAPSGYSFSGWSCDNNIGNKAIGETFTMPAANVTCTAQWEQLYNVIYNCNNSGFGGTAPATQSYYVGNTVSILSNMPQNTCVAPNMMFDHWDCHKENENTVSFNSGSAMQAYNVVCDAQWVHRVQYACGSGTQQTSNVYVTTSDASVILADIGSFCAAPSGYVFYKWACIADDNGFAADFYDSGYNYVFTSPSIFCTAVYREIPCNSGETTVPFVLGQEMTLADWENNSSVWGGYSNITLGNLWNPTSASYSGNSATFLNSSSNWTVTMNGKCSNTWGMTGETGYPSDIPGVHCWCQAGSVVVNGSSTTLINYPWVYQGQIGGGCTANSCADICAIQAANAYNYSTDMASFFLQSLYTQNTCVSAPTTYTVTYHGGSCNAAAASISENVSSGTQYNVKNPSCQNSGLGTLLPGLPSSCRRFVGWATTSGGGVVYGSCDSTNCTCGGPVTISGNMNLYAACEDVPHDVIYYGGNCGNDLTPYTDENALTYGMNPEYSVRPVEEMGWSGIIPTSQFQGWSDSPYLSEICATQSSELYQLLRGGHTENSSLGYSPADECSNVDLYAVCCPLNLNWVLDGGSWPTGSSGNQLTCEYGASAGLAGSIIGYGQTPLQTPLKTGYTFTGWKVTGYSTP